MSADVTQMPRIFAATSLCMSTGRPEEAVVYAQAEIELEADPSYDALDREAGRAQEATAHLTAGADSS